MPALYASIAVLLVASWATGQAVHRLAGLRAGPLAPATGLAALMCVAAVAIRLPGHGDAAAVALVAVPVACLVALRGRVGLPGPAELAVAVATLAAASIPFAVNGRMGIVGMSFQDDLALHLTLTDSLRLDLPSSLSPVIADYPVGPHALAGTVASLLGSESTATLAALLMLCPAIAGLAALSAHDGLGAVRRAAGAVTVGLAYLAVAFLVEGSVKETLLGALVLAFALGLREVAREAGPARRAIPLGVLTAAMLLVYGLSAAAWPVLIAGLWLAGAALDRRPTRAGAVAAARGALAAAGACLLAVAGQADRLVGFSATGTVGSAGGAAADFPGNLRTYLPFFEGLGLWPAPDYRVVAPELALTLGLMGGIAAAAAVYGELWWLRRRDLVVPLAAAACVVVWLGTRWLQGPYVNSKALAIAAPMLMALTIRPLLSPPERRLDGLALTAIATAVIVFALGSASLPLRYAPIGPLEHAREVRSLRAALGGGPVLFVGRDNFVGWELLGARLATTDPYGLAFQSGRLVPTRPGKRRGVGTTTDFDTVEARALDRFDHLITTRSAFSSRPGAGWAPVRHTRFYTLWRRRGATGERRVLDGERSGPGAVLDCESPEGRRLARSGGVAAVRPAPVVGTARRWQVAGGRRARPDPAGYIGVQPGERVEQSLRLGPGRWELSLQYVGHRHVRVQAPGLSVVLPANLTVQSTYWRLGELRSPGSDLAVSVDTGAPPAVTPRPDLLFGTLAAVRVDAPPRVVPLAGACGRYVDWYRLG